MVVNKTLTGKELFFSKTRGSHGSELQRLQPQRKSLNHMILIN
ncbi:hypothetical protein ACZ87_00732 [Candidatus Erwinia dacicola]|uniref:Uncharacterized protein n=1 Tax=Candidatus Erwinia dacicola TaxID=252393 RepID=A0A328TTP0_9GAMM|nr:hypothetical protein ACZ87_00732 [Candidatus Erwinia dacicola]